jgi:hypothetical protein
MFVKKLRIDFIIAQVYIDDIKLGSASKYMSTSLNSCKYEISIVGDLIFVLDSLIKQIKDGIFISQTKYANNLTKKFNMEGSKPIRTPSTVT